MTMRRRAVLQMLGALLAGCAMAPARAFVALRAAPAGQLAALSPRGGALRAQRSATWRMGVPPRPLNPNVPTDSAAARLRLLLEKPGMRMRGCQ